MPQNWVIFPSWVCEIWCSQGLRAIACCDLDLWPFDLISMSRAQVHRPTWRNFGKISSNIYEDIVFTRWADPVFRLIACCELEISPLIPKANQHIYEPNTSVTKIGWNSLYWFLKYDVHKVFGSFLSVTLTFDLLTLKSNQHIHECKYICD